MLCKNPFVQGVLPFGCGQCLPCRIQRRRLWTHRILLESFKHAQSCFITLTYSEDKLPPGESLRPKDVQDWLKRIRKAVSPAALRFFLVGEYGDESQRPHYHVALFGYAPCVRGRTDHREIQKKGSCCVQCDLLRETWGHGGVDVGLLEKDSAQYIAGYVTKKMTHKEEKCSDSCTHPPLRGRSPEFARMSLRPGIGASAMDTVASAFLGVSGQSGLSVPRMLKHGPKTMPLGKYLRGKLHEKLAREKDPVEIQKFALQMHGMLEDAFKDPANRSRSVKKIITEKNKQKVLSLENRIKIFSKGKKI